MYSSAWYAGLPSRLVMDAKVLSRTSWAPLRSNPSTFSRKTYFGLWTIVWSSRIKLRKPADLGSAKSPFLPLRVCGWQGGLIAHTSTGPNFSSADVVSFFRSERNCGTVGWLNAYVALAPGLTSKLPTTSKGFIGLVVVEEEAEDEDEDEEDAEPLFAPPLFEASSFFCRLLVFFCRCLLLPVSLSVSWQISLLVVPKTT